MKILLATDGSNHSEAAVDEIARKPFPAQSELLVISVFEMPAFPIAVPWAGVDFDAELGRTATVAVEKAAVKLRAGAEGCKLKITTKVVSGSPKRVILEEAEAFDADLIVLGARGLGAWDRLLLGSVSQAVVAHAECSVEVVRSRTEK